MPVPESYIWNVTPGLAPALAASGCKRVYIKAFGDGSGHVWSQWSAATLQPFVDAGITPIPWGFVLHDYATDIAQLPGVLAAFDAPEVVLNVEIGEGHWDGASDAEATACVAAARQAAPGRLIGFSSCPSWDGDPQRGAPAFPYEGFAQACDYSQPQQYFLPSPDQVTYEVQRNTTGKAVRPILWGEWDDATLAQQAQHCLDVLGARCTGLSAWEAGNAQYNTAGMGAVYGVLAAVQELTVPPATDPPAAPYARAYLNDQHEPIIEINFGGYLDGIDGFVVNDAGVSGHHGADQWDRSIKVDFLPWTERTPAPTPVPAPAPPPPDPAPTPPPPAPPPPDPAPAPPPPTGGLMSFTDHGAIPLTEPDPHGADAVDPATGNVAEVYVDMQKDHKLVVWWQPKGWLAAFDYQPYIPNRWLLAIGAIIHGAPGQPAHLKIRLTHCPPNDTANLQVGFIDLGPVADL